MPKSQFQRSAAPDSVSLKVGGWLEAHATGRGVIAVPIIVVLLLVGGAVVALIPAIVP